jgi:GntR family transcriptional regulator, vanillate catabolism transcriptional regulator
MSLQETVLIQLRDLILRGEFGPGQRLAEQQLAERLSASRTPVRAALVTLEQEGLVEANDTGKYLVRQYTPREVADAIAVRGHLEGMAARLVAEHGVGRQLAADLQACLDEGDRALAADPLNYESYAAYAAMNDRFHALILEASGNRALQRAVALNDKLPFAPASAMLPMQSSVALDHDWMRYAHRQHHMLVAALQAGEGARAQALAVEHTEVAQMNMRMALLNRSETERVMPALRLVVGG